MRYHKKVFCIQLETNKALAEGSFYFKETTPTNDDYEKTIGDIEKKILTFNCHVKKLDEDFFFFFFGLPVYW